MTSFRQGLTRYLEPGFLQYLEGLRVGIIGAGGLGSNCAVHLVRSGFSHLVIADHDHVEASNLNRQHYRLNQVGRLKIEALGENLLAINPELRLELHANRVDAKTVRTLFVPCDAVVEAVDEAPTKKLIVEACMPHTLVVSASGMGGFGLAGGMRVRRVGNLIQVGDFSTACSATHPPLAPGVAMAAALQADAILNHFHTLWRNHDRT